MNRTTIPKSKRTILTTTTLSIAALFLLSSFAPALASPTEVQLATTTDGSGAGNNFQQHLQIADNYVWDFYYLEIVPQKMGGSIDNAFVYQSCPTSSGCTTAAQWGAVHPIYNNSFGNGGQCDSSYSSSANGFAIVCSNNSGFVYKTGTQSSGVISWSGVYTQKTHFNNTVPPYINFNSTSSIWVAIGTNDTTGNTGYHVELWHGAAGNNTMSLKYMVNSSQSTNPLIGAVYVSGSSGQKITFLYGSANSVGEANGTHIAVAMPVYLTTSGSTGSHGSWITPIPSACDYDLRSSDALIQGLDLFFVGVATNNAGTCGGGSGMNGGDINFGEYDYGTGGTTWGGSTQLPGSVNSTGVSLSLKSKTVFVVAFTPRPGTVHLEYEVYTVGGATPTPRSLSSDSHIQSTSIPSSPQTTGTTMLHSAWGWTQGQKPAFNVKAAYGNPD